MARERDRVQAMSQAPKDGLLLENARDMITLSGLRKVYPDAGKGTPKVAVHDLWLGIPEGECFGYLGINVSSNACVMCASSCVTVRMQHDRYATSMLMCVVCYVLCRVLVRPRH